MWFGLKAKCFRSEAFTSCKIPLPTFTKRLSLIFKHTFIMKSTLTLLLALVVNLIMAQKPTPDAIETSKSTLTIQPLNHATMVFKFNGKTIYHDPQGGAKLFER